MPTAEIDNISTELEQVEHWRAQALVRAGYPADGAALCIRTPPRRRPAPRGRAASRRLSPEIALRILFSPARATWFTTADGGPARLHPLAASGTSTSARSRPYVRAELLVAILACVWLTAGAGSAGGDSGSRRARRRLGRRVRRDRRPRLPRPHVVERGARPEVEGRLRGLAGRPRRLGRHPARHARGRGRSSAARRRRALFMDAAAPGLLLAQGIGRIGNWCNQELYGKPTTLPWGLEIDVRPPPGRTTSTARRSTRRSSTS